MRPLLIAGALLATAACARAVLPVHGQEPPTDEERADARAEEQRAEELERALSVLSAGQTAPDCSRACELVGQICDLSRRICLISARHGDDAELAGRCSAAENRCRRSQDRIPPSCSCPAARGANR